jgi:hypothetical protein
VLALELVAVLVALLAGQLVEVVKVVQVEMALQRLVLELVKLPEQQRVRKEPVR